MGTEKKTAVFAFKPDFPESNAFLGAGDNPNTHGIDIWREPNGQPIIISKILLDDEDLRFMNENRCFFLSYRAYSQPPVTVYTQSPFITAEEIEAELSADIALVNERLRTALSLKRVSKGTTYDEANAINVENKQDMFVNCEQLKMHIIKNSAPALLEKLGPEDTPD